MQYVHKTDEKEREEHKSREEGFKLEEREKKNKKKKTLTIVVVCLLIVAVIIIYAVQTPGSYDDFAKCLSEKGAVMYGEDWCQYTNAQKAMFGKSFKYVNYEVKQGLNIRPTWVIDGKSYETVQSFQRLSQLTGCKY